MAYKIDQNCTVYDEQKLALRVAEWREITPKGEMVVKSNDFLLTDYDFPKICNNAKQNFCKQYGMVDPVGASMYCAATAPTMDLDAPILPPPETPSPMDLPITMDQLAIPLLIGGAVIGALLFFYK